MRQINPGASGGDSDLLRIFELEKMYKVARTSSYALPTFTSGDLTKMEVWVTIAQATKLFTRTLNYNGSGDLTSVVTFDETDGATLTTTLTYDGSGDFSSRTKVLS
tara:strand:- start:98 stop:415 length:318 start_codon:yes stop_codon:yes gene_type:complete